MADPKHPLQQAGMMGELQSEVSVEAAPLLQFIMKHVGLVVGVVLLLIAGIIATGIYQWHSAGSLRDAQLAMGKILTGRLVGADRVAALEALDKSVPDSMRIGLWLEVASAAREAEDYTKAAAAFARVGQLDKSPLGITAVLNQSDMLIKAGNPAQALSVLEPLAASAPESMRLTVQESLAGAAEAAGNAQKAVEVYKAMMASGQTQDIAYYKARIAALEAK